MKKVLVAMSGGVDSSVAAALLLEAGYDVTGGFIKNWSDTKDPLSSVCSWRAERRDALRVASRLGIPLLTFDFEKQYRAKIVSELYRGYEKGETPNPDVLCNEYIKFGLFWEQAKKLGFDYMATGHYAALRHQDVKTSKHPTFKVQGVNDVRMYRGSDSGKDQSYFLYRVPQNVLRRTLLPIGTYKKSEVRRLAKKFQLPIASKPDSQGICFIGKIDFSKFLSKKIKSKPGNIVTPEGEVIGRHQGLHNYTIGQRQKIAISGNHPWYVAVKDIKNNRLIAVSSAKHPLLISKTLIVDDLRWIAGKAPSGSFTGNVQVRYRQKALTAKISPIAKSEKFKLEFNKPVSSAAIGQSAVIYKGKECLGGGIIRQSHQM